MTDNGFKISLRVLFKHRLYTGISLLGLGIAIASFWFIASFVKKSNEYDNFQTNAERIYRVTTEITAGGETEHYATSGKPLGSTLSENYTGINAFARLNSWGNVVVKINTALFSETGFFAANPGTLEVFNFDFISGNESTSLSRPNSIVLSRSLAEKYFNSVNVVDQQLWIGGNQYSIKGVFEDWPENSHLKPTALVYSESPTSNYEIQDWFDMENYTYVLLDPSTDQKKLNENLGQLRVDYLVPGLQGSGVDVAFQSQPLKGIYFEPALLSDIPKGNPRYIIALGMAGLLVLLIAGLNYINLSLTQSTKRSNEIRLKKLLGISRKQLFFQSAAESSIMTLLAMVISGILIAAFDNVYFKYSGFSALDLMSNGYILIIVLFVTFVFGLIGNGYSGMYLSFSSAPMNTEKKSTSTFKRILLGFQFAVASVIIMATITMTEQIDFMKNKDLGFSKEHVLIISVPGNDELKSKLIQFRERIKDFSTIEHASLIGGGALPGEDNGKEIFQVAIDGNEVEKVYNFYRIDENYCNLLNINFDAGRNFETHRASDKTDAVLINQALANSLNWDDPLGKTIHYGGEPRKVIGVVQNFHNTSLHNVIEPIVFLYDENFSSNLLVKAQLSDIENIKALWADFFPDTPFELRYFDEFIATMYSKEDYLSKLLSFFSLVSLGLCCMGLFAIFSLHILHKTKELSIRKVLGAGAANLINAATKNYIIIVVLAIGTAIPISWYFMNNWLGDFSYRIDMNPLIFVYSASLVLLMSCLTLLYHIIKSINVNPIDSLRNE